MTEALNFTAKAIADLSEIAAMSHIAASDKMGLRFVAEKLRKAEVFVLPDAGELLDRSKPYPQVAPAVFRPPFPVVALEYRALDRGSSDPLYEAAVASRRISLAWNWDGVTPGGRAPVPEDEQGVMVASVSYFERLGKWMPVALAVLLPFEGTYRSAEELPEHTKAFLDSGRISERQARAPALQTGAVLQIMPAMFAAASKEWGAGRAMSMAAGDLMDEVNAYRDLCIALACTNVAVESHQQPERLNKSRIKKGKLPLRDFHVLNIGGEGSEGVALGTASGGMRSHLRREHIRRLSPDRITWVNSCMVRGSRAGFVDKQYAPRSRAAAAG